MRRTDDRRDQPAYQVRSWTHAACGTSVRRTSSCSRRAGTSPWTRPIGDRIARPPFSIPTSVSFERLRVNHYTTQVRGGVPPQAVRVARRQQHSKRDRFTRSSSPAWPERLDAVEDRTIQMYLPALREELARRRPAGLGLASTRPSSGPTTSRKLSTPVSLKSSWTWGGPCDDLEPLPPHAGMHLCDEHGRQPGGVHECGAAQIQHQRRGRVVPQLRQLLVERRHGGDVELAGRP